MENEYENIYEEENMNANQNTNSRLRVNLYFKKISFVFEIRIEIF
jgi:hypothetical protein